MADNKKDGNNKKNNDASAFDRVAKSILSIVDSGYSERTRLISQNDKFQSIINRELDLSKGVSQNSIVDFIMSASTNTTSTDKNKSPKEVDTSSLFTRDIGDIFNYFQDVYKNKFIEMTDLKFISKFIPALGEAVKTTLDAIVASDDISETITRNIVLPANISEEDKSLIMNEVIRVEKELKLLKRLRNVVYKKTLVTGKFYVYAVPYQELFEEFSKNKAAGKYLKNGINVKNAPIFSNNRAPGFNISKANEATENIDLVPAIESCTSLLKNSLSKEEQKEISGIEGKLKSSLPIVTVNRSTYIEEAFDGFSGLEQIMALEQAASTDGHLFSDGTVQSMLTNAVDSIDGTKDIKKVGAEKFDVSGTYIKYIESKNVIPIRILNKVVGYYYIHPTNRRTKNGASGTNGMVSVSSSVFSSVNMTENKKEEAITNIVNIISEGILKKFNAKFVSDNSEYKQMIADCIISHGFIDNDYMIQFIPAEHMVEFVINEDENGNGESILQDSLFPAKLLLSLIICKMLTYMNKSGNKNFAHVYKGPIDISSNNQLNRVVRMLQESNITFNDLLSTNMVFSKFTRDSNIALPTAKNGNKLVEMETLEGQQVDMKTDFEDKLEQMAILGTGVPTVILEYMNSADFAKQIVSANIKFAGRTSTLQSDLEDPSTDLYRKLIKNSTLPDNLKSQCVNSLLYKLPRPKALVNANNSEFISNIQSMAQTMADVIIGQNPNNDDKVAKKKDMVIKQIIIDSSPFIDWAKYEELFKNATIEATELEQKKDETV